MIIIIIKSLWIIIIIITSSPVFFYMTVFILFEFKKSIPTFRINPVCVGDRLQTYNPQLKYSDPR